MANPDKRRARAKEKKKKKSKAGGQPKPRRKVAVKYGEAAGLQVLGPLLNGIVAHPSNGKAIQGVFLVDTGASDTCISCEVARELKLDLVDERETHGAGGVSKNEVYFAGVTIPIDGDKLTFSTKRPLLGVPKLDDQFVEIRKKFPGGFRMIGLLGRDFLSLGKLIYDGQRGEFSFELSPKVIWK